MFLLEMRLYLLSVLCTIDVNCFPYNDCEQSNSFCLGQSDEAGGNCVHRESCSVLVSVTSHVANSSAFSGHLEFNIYGYKPAAKAVGWWISVGISTEEEEDTTKATLECSAFWGNSEIFSKASTGVAFPDQTHSYNLYDSKNSGLELTSTAYVKDGEYLHCQFEQARYSAVVSLRSTIKSGSITYNGSYHCLRMNWVDNAYFISITHGVLNKNNADPMAHVLASSDIELKATSDKRALFDLLYFDCSSSPLIHTKHCFGHSASEELEDFEHFSSDCLRGKSCHILVILTKVTLGYSLELRIQNISDWENFKLTRYISTGLLFLAEKRVEFSSEFLVHNYLNLTKHDYFQENPPFRSIDAIRPILVNNDCSLQHSVILECQWLIKDINFTDTGHFVKVFVEYGTVESSKKRAVQKLTTKKSLVFNSFKDRSVKTDCNKSDVQCFGFLTSDQNETSCINAENCLIRATFESNRMILTGYVDSRTWIAAAFSEDTSMGDDMVFECFYIKGTIVARSSWNEQQKENSIAKILSGVKYNGNTIKDNKLSCVFEFSETIRFTLENGETKTWTLPEQDIYLFLAYGDIRQLDLGDGRQTFIKSKHIDNFVAKNSFKNELKKTEEYTMNYGMYAIVGVCLIVLIVVVALATVVVKFRSKERKSVKEQKSPKEEKSGQSRKSVRKTFSRKDRKRPKVIVAPKQKSLRRSPKVKKSDELVVRLKKRKTTEELMATSAILQGPTESKSVGSSKSRVASTVDTLKPPLITRISETQLVISKPPST